MNANIYIDKKADREGRHQLFCQVTGKGKRTAIYLGIKIELANWINGAIHKREINADLKNALLHAKVGKIKKIIADAELNMISLEPSEVKEIFSREKERENEPEQTTGKHKIVSYFDFYEHQYKSIFKHNTIRGHKQVKDRIAAFDPEITLEDINQAWLVRYCSHLVELEMEDSTIKDRHLKSIKTIAKEARRNGIKVSDQVDRFRWKSQNKQPFFATWEEVEGIQALNEFVLPIQERIRDLFILSCYTGLRDSDLKSISKENLFKQGTQMMLQVRVIKTGFDYSIPLSSTVDNILKKYKYDIKTVSQQEYNREIKNIARHVVKGTMIKVKNSGSKRITEKTDRFRSFTTHTGRRTFGRRFLDKGGSLIVLSKIYGHKNLETTLRYIGYQPQEVVSEFQKVFG